MTKVFVNIGLSLDGYMALEGTTLERWEQPSFKNWGAKWGALMGWALKQQYIRENRKLGPGGETGPVSSNLNLGVIDELEIAMAPVPFGGGIRLLRNYANRLQNFELTACLIVQQQHTCVAA
jgi:hypothetical protein